MRFVWIVLLVAFIGCTGEPKYDPETQWLVNAVECPTLIAIDRVGADWFARGQPVDEQESPLYNQDIVEDAGCVDWRNEGRSGYFTPRDGLYYDFFEYKVRNKYEWKRRTEIRKGGETFLEMEHPGPKGAPKWFLEYDMFYEGYDSKNYRVPPTRLRINTVLWASEEGTYAFAHDLSG